MKKSALTTRSLRVMAGSKTLFDSIDLDIYFGQVTLIMGENGIGKSSLLNYLCALIKTFQGDIFIKGINLRLLSSASRAKLISSIAQYDTSADDIIVEERIAHGLSARRGPGALLDTSTLQKVHKLCKRLQIEHLLGKSLGKISGGERKLTHIARCLIDDEASVFILDEPFVNLDIRYQKIVATILKSLAAQNKCVLLSTHDISLCLRLACRTIVLSKNQILADGPPSQALTPELIKSIYGTSGRILTTDDGFCGLVMPIHV